MTTPNNQHKQKLCATAQAALAQAFPNLTIDTLRLAGEGWTCHGFLVNDSVLFKIPQKPEFASAITTELHALSALEGKTSAPIPKILYQGTLADGRPVIGETVIKGEVIHAAGYEALTSQQRQAFLADLGKTVQEIRTAAVDSPHFPKTTLPQIMAATKADFTDSIKSHLSLKEQSLMNQFFAAYEHSYDKEAFTPTFSQGDIYVENIMYDPKSKKMTGLIDFGLAGYTDPYDDLHHFLEYDPSPLGKASGLKMGYHGKLRTLFFAMKDLLSSYPFMQEKNQGKEAESYLHLYLKNYQHLQANNTLSLGLLQKQTGYTSRL